MIRVGIVEDHKMVRQSFVQVIEASGKFQVTEQFNSYEEIYEQVKLLDIDILLIDISLPGKNGIEVGQLLELHNKAIKKIFISMYEHESYIYAAIKAGAKAYLSKRAAAEELTQALEAVSQREQYLSDDIQKLFSFKRLMPSSKIELLTVKEKELFKLFAMGHVPKKVAMITGTMPKTILNQRASIFEKLQVNSQFDLLRLALAEGIIEYNEFMIA